MDVVNDVTWFVVEFSSCCKAQSYVGNLEIASVSYCPYYAMSDEICVYRLGTRNKLHLYNVSSKLSKRL